MVNSGNKAGGAKAREASREGQMGKKAQERRSDPSSTIFNFVFAVPLALLGTLASTRKAIVQVAGGTAGAFSNALTGMSGTMEGQTVQKLYGATVDLFSGFAELGALGMAITLLLWVSGLFFGLAFMSVFVSLACVYVLAMATGMNLILDRVRIYLRDCFVLRVCAYTIPMVTVLKGLRFTTGVTVHFPEKSMVWILHAGRWVVRLCWSWKAGLGGDTAVQGGVGSDGAAKEVTDESDSDRWQRESGNVTPVGVRAGVARTR